MSVSVHPAVRSRLPTLSEWALWGLVALVCGLAIRHDFRREPIFGDQSSHLLQALSLAYDFDLKYDAGDMARWKTIGWMRTPAGLFYQTYSGGAAFAKPYLYSGFLAPFIRITGVRFGVALANSTIFILLIFVSLKIARLYFDRTVGPLLVVAFLFASNVYFYVFVIHPDLFHGLLTACFCYGALRHFHSSNNLLVCVIAALLGICVSEKLSMLFLLLPVFLYGLNKTPFWRMRGLAVLVFLAAFGLCLLPYLHYSDYKSWNAYGGERFYNAVGLPVPELKEFLTPATGMAYPAKFVRLHLPSTELLRSAWYYLFGAYTGVFVFAPAVLFFGVASLCRSDRPKILPWTVGIVLMALSYLIFDPFNYFGGGQSIGNRWFIEAIPLALAMAVEADLSFAIARRLALAAGIVSALLIYPHHLDPVHAFAECGRSGRFQRWFPLEINQRSMPEYWTGKGYPLNISWFPCPPRWYARPPGEPEVWHWQNGMVVPAPSCVLYQQEYFDSKGKTFFALLDKSETGEVLATYHFGRAGEFRSAHKKGSLLVRCGTDRAEIGVVPLGHASWIRAFSAPTEQYFNLPVKLILEPERSRPDRFYKVDFSGDDNFSFVKADFLPADSNFVQQLRMR